MKIKLSSTLTCTEVLAFAAGSGEGRAAVGAAPLASGLCGPHHGTARGISPFGRAS